ncbi:hypothetical protein ACFQX7_36400 [Luedemannella flava]
MLDGRPATTHWNNAEHFQRTFPNVNVDADVLFTDDGEVLTAAGVASGVDLCLHLVRRDHGSAVANRVARLCVVPRGARAARRSSSTDPCPSRRPPPHRTPGNGRSRSCPARSPWASWPGTRG